MIYFFIFNIIVMCAFVTSDAYANTLQLVHRIALAQAKAEGRSDVVMMMAIHRGQTHKIVRAMQQERIRPSYVDYNLDYVRAAVPIEKVMKLALSDVVIASSLASGKYYYHEEKMKTGNENRRRKPKITLEEYVRYVKENKKADWREPMGVRSLWESYPAYDGRGVVVAVIEMFIDPFQPEFKAGMDENGKEVEKIVEIRGVYNRWDSSAERDQGLMPGYVGLTRIRNQKPYVVIGSRQYISPVVGDIEIGTVDLRHLIYKSEPEDFTKGNSNLFESVGVLKNLKDNCLYIDADDDGDFTDEICSLDFNEGRLRSKLRLRVGELVGKPFFIVNNSSSDGVILATATDHTHEISAVAVAEGMWKAEISGVAPGARLINFGTSGRSDEILEAMIMAAKDPRIDIILPMIGHYHAQIHDSSVYSIIADRIAQNYNKVLVAPGGNSRKMLASVSEISGPTRTIAAGQFFGSEISGIFSGAKIADTVSISSAGPTADGALKPDVVAPSMVITTTPGYIGADRELNRQVCPNIELPETASCGTGTSFAAPVTAGAAAILISAAKQHDIKYKEEDIRESLQATAHVISGEKSYVQGRGVINLPSAVRYLKQLSEEKSDRSKIRVVAPVRSQLSFSLPVPDSGRGLFEREGWEPGQVGIREVLVVRTSGPKDAETLNIELIGNSKGVFTAPDRLRFPLGVPVKVPVTVRATGQGVHSAIMRIYDPRNGLLVGDVSLVIVVAIPLSEIDNYEVIWKGEVPKADVVEIFVRVPDDSLFLEFGTKNGEGIWASFAGPLGSLVAVENWDHGVGFPQSNGDPIKELRALSYAPSGGVWTLRLHSLSIDNGPSQINARIRAGKERNRAKNWPISKNDRLQEYNRRVEDRWFGGYSDGLKIVKTVGLYYQGAVTLRYGEVPAVLPVAVPKGASRILLSARKRTGENYKDSEPLFLTAFQCRERKCFAVDMAAGRTLARALIDRASTEEWSESWAIAFDPGVIGPNGASVEYEIFIDLAGTSFYSSGDAHLADAARVGLNYSTRGCLSGGIIEALMLIEPSVTKPIYGWNKRNGGRPVLENEVTVPYDFSAVNCLKSDVGKVNYSVH